MQGLPWIHHSVLQPPGVRGALYQPPQNAPPAVEGVNVAVVTHLCFYDRKLEVGRDCNFHSLQGEDSAEVGARLPTPWKTSTH